MCKLLKRAHYQDIVSLPAIMGKKITLISSGIKINIFNQVGYKSVDTIRYVLV